MATSIQQGTWWSHLPDDILDLVYRWIASPFGRVRFAAVCRAWHAVASWRLPPPPLPLLLLSTYDRANTKELYCLEDGGVLRVRLPPTDMARKWILGSHYGGWVTAVSVGPILILNLFSGAEVVLSAEQRRIDPSDCSTDPSKISRIIFSEEPTSETCILAAISHSCRVALCRVGCADKGWTMEGRGMEKLTDIAFCHGELYGLALERDQVTLLKFGIGVNELVVTAIHIVAIQSLPLLLLEHEDDVNVHAVYIFEMRSKLAMAVKTGEYFFRVFELVDVNNAAMLYKCRWAEMTSLRDYALFLGPTCSTAVEVCAGGRGGVQRNHIYYSNERYGHLPFHKRYLTKMGDGRGVYYDEDEIVCDDGKVIMSRGFYCERRVQAAMWLVPPHF